MVGIVVAVDVTACFGRRVRASVEVMESILELLGGVLGSIGGCGWSGHGRDCSCCFGVLFDCVDEY